MSASLQPKTIAPPPSLADLSIHPVVPSCRNRGVAGDANTYELEKSTPACPLYGGRVHVAQLKVHEPEICEVIPWSLRPAERNHSYHILCFYLQVIDVAFHGMGALL